MRSAPPGGGAPAAPPPPPRPPPAAAGSAAAAGATAAPCGRALRIISAVEPLLKAMDCALSHPIVTPLARFLSSARLVVGACSPPWAPAAPPPRPPPPPRPARFAPGGATKYATQRESSENCGPVARGILVSVPVAKLLRKSVSSRFRCE